jgi:hypothetical protein
MPPRAQHRTSPLRDAAETAVADSFGGDRDQPAREPLVAGQLDGDVAGGGAAQPAGVALEGHLDGRLDEDLQRPAKEALEVRLTQPVAQRR